MPAGQVYIVLFNNVADHVYLDRQDPLLNNGGSSFNIHLNAGFSLVMEDKFEVNLAALL